MRTEAMMSDEDEERLLQIFLCILAKPTHPKVRFYVPIATDFESQLVREAFILSPPGAYLFASYWSGPLPHELAKKYVRNSTLKSCTLDDIAENWNRFDLHSRPERDSEIYLLDLYNLVNKRKPNPT